MRWVRYASLGIVTEAFRRSYISFDVQCCWGSAFPKFPTAVVPSRREAFQQESFLNCLAFADEDIRVGKDSPMAAESYRRKRGCSVDAFNWEMK